MCLSTGQEFTVKCYSEQTGQNRTWVPQHTETVEAERAIVEEVADVTSLGWHGAEDVSAAGGEGVQADQKHVDEQRPGVAVRQEVQRGAQHAEPPQEVPRAAQLRSCTHTSLPVKEMSSFT